MELSLSVSTESMMKGVISESGRMIVLELSEKYGFDVDEGMRHVNLEGKRIVFTGVKRENKSVGQSRIPLPFCGTMCDENCAAIRLNHGLYTQCTNEHSIVHNIDEKTVNLCKTCHKQTDKNSNNKPTYGYIMDRIELGDSFRDPKGKIPVPYGNIMEKLNITREDAEKEATKQGQTIPENQFDVKKARRGRPKKDTTAVDTSGSEEEPQKKTRGRPKKEKQVVSASAGEELIKDLVTQAHATMVPDPVPDPVSVPVPLEVDIPSSSDAVDVSSDEDEEELAVTEFKIGGKKYLKSADNTIYDIKTHEEIGTWNPKTKQIEEDDE